MKKAKMSSANRKNKKKKIVNNNLNEDEEVLEKEPNGSLAWKVLLPSQIRTLSHCETPEELQEKLAHILDFENHEVDLKEAIQLDYFLILFHWAKEQGFDERQLSGFMTLMSNLLDNIKDHNMKKSENFNFLKDCFSGIASDNLDVVSIPLYFFKLDHAKSIMSYVLRSFFQHYSLYEFIFKNEQDKLIIGNDLNVNVCPEMQGPFPAPLVEAMPLEIHEKYVVQLQASKENANNEKSDAELVENFTDAVLNSVKSSESEVTKTVSTSEIRKIIEKIMKGVILPAKADLQNKIKDKELAYLAKIEKC